MNNFNNDTPIYVQLANKIEETIIERSIKEGERVPSQVDLGKMFNINPATAGKALTLLLERGVVDKKRGLGMFVTDDALPIIKERRLKQNLSALAREYLNEGVTLGFDIDSLITLLKEEHLRLNATDDKEDDNEKFN